MPIAQIPIIKGVGKNANVADYVDLLPVNMLAVPKNVLNAAGYMRTFPGLRRISYAVGPSRGAEYNTKKNKVYRVMGPALYEGGTNLFPKIPGEGRVSMAHSFNSQGIAADGKLYLWNYTEGEFKTLDNWPPFIVKTEGKRTKIGTTKKFTLTDEVMQDGEIQITLTPKRSSGETGEKIVLFEKDWHEEQNQEDKGDDKPYLTHIKITGEKKAGSEITISWTFHGWDYREDETEVLVEHVVGEVRVEYSQYEIGVVRDICHNRARYIWVKKGTDNFGVTDLEDESHPDQYRPFYRAESMPDGIIGVASWRDMVACFGSSTIEYFSLTGSSGTTDPIYIAQSSLMVDIGIAGTHCKCKFAESFAILSHPACGLPSVYIIDNGSKQTIATATVERILASYTADELAEAVMESLRFESHELLIIHLPRHTLCFDASASKNGPQWCILKSGLYDDVWCGIDLIYDGLEMTAGDKTRAWLGALDFSLASQYEESTEFIVHTPLMKMDNALLFDFELELNTGLPVAPPERRLGRRQLSNDVIPAPAPKEKVEKCFVSATTDGAIYGREQLVPYNKTYCYDRRLLLRQVGRVRKNIGFRVRFLSYYAFSVSDCKVRVENV